MSSSLVHELFNGLIHGNRTALSRAITSIEAKRPICRELLHMVNEHNIKTRPKTMRIGISGGPGCGKSTFIESFGMNLIEKYNKKVAVLAIDPSSAIYGGSILADKTRMFNLSRNPNAYVRPSPSSGYLGGVTQSTGRSIIELLSHFLSIISFSIPSGNVISLCESAGYEVILIETVGVGQSEYEVSYLCDLMALLVAPSGGDELQAIKKGIVEMANIIIVTKSDGDLVRHARKMSAEIMSATKFINFGERPVVKRISSVTNEGIDEVWTEMQALVECEDKKLEKRREQRVRLLRVGLVNEFLSEIKRRIPLDKYENMLRTDQTVIVEDLIEKIFDEYVVKSFHESELKEI